jgi:CheY-like chemotaxis protein
LLSIDADVDEVSSGLEAITAITKAELPYDLILLDWKMPGMDGIETAMRLKKLPLNCLSPEIIMVSAYDRDDVMGRSSDVGISSYLVKPFSQRTLLNTIKSVLGAKALDGDRGESGNAGSDLSTDVAFWQGTRLLLVEDNEMNQELACELLGQAGIEVVVAENGQVALECLVKDRFDGILMDIQMPVMDGYTATLRIRNDPQFGSLPIIAMTADAMEADKKRVFEVGMDDFVSKPIDIEQLFNVLRNRIKPPKSI